MPRRVTVPDDHVALVLPNQLAGELSSLMRSNRRAALRTFARTQDVSFQGLANVAGDVMLALLEAREA